MILNMGIVEQQLKDVVIGYGLSFRPKPIADLKDRLVFSRPLGLMKAARNLFQYEGFLNRTY